MRNDTRISVKQQDGAALVIALVLLISVTLLSLASVSNSVLEMNMASADEDRMQAFQAADSAISMVITGFTTYVSGLGDGEERCVNHPTGGTCDFDLIGATSLFETGDQLDVTLTLIGGDLDPIRIRDAGRILGKGDAASRLGAMDTSARRFEYVIESELNRRANNRGYAHVWRGFSRQVSTPSSTTSGDFSNCGDGGGGSNCS